MKVQVFSIVWYTFLREGASSAVRGNAVNALRSLPLPRRGSARKKSVQTYSCTLLSAYRHLTSNTSFLHYFSSSFQLCIWILILKNRVRIIYVNFEYVCETIRTKFHYVYKKYTKTYRGTVCADSSLRVSISTLFKGFLPKIA